MSKNKSPGDGSGSNASPRRIVPLASGSGAFGGMSSYSVVPAASPASWIRAWLRIRSSASWPMGGTAVPGALSPSARRVPISESTRRRRWPRVIPATSDRWSSARRWSAHTPYQRHTLQCSTGSGYVTGAGTSPNTRASNARFTER
jgi:hypothetical protein